MSAKNRVWARLLLVAALALPLTTAAPRVAQAAAIGVNTLADEYDTAGSGTGCSLREAIVAANTDSAFGGCSAGSGADTINLPTGTYTFTISGNQEEESATGDLDILSPMTISGSSAEATIINANRLDRVLHINGAGAVTLANLSVQGGFDTYFGAGVMSQGAAVTLTHSTVISNVSQTSIGGIMLLGGSLVVEHSELRENGSRAIASRPSSFVHISHTLIQDNFGGG